jgi:hypothetical protein
VRRFALWARLAVPESVVLPVGDSDCLRVLVHSLVLRLASDARGRPATATTRQRLLRHKQVRRNASS